eukprot:Rhum_TRINITY_DN15396_c6_g7::Rhum_TRINITY_DN15396_c6_g7_i2::g.153974::m.153974
MGVRSRRRAAGSKPDRKGADCGLRRKAAKRKKHGRVDEATPASLYIVNFDYRKCFDRLPRAILMCDGLASPSPATVAVAAATTAVLALGQRRDHQEGTIDKQAKESSNSGGRG